MKSRCISPLAWIVLPALLHTLAVCHAPAQDWETVSFIEHSTYQAVTANGSSAYAGGFPLRLIGVVLNNTEDWLDPTPGYTPTYVPWNLGGQAEIFVQAVNLDTVFGGAYDPFPLDPFDDFGGTAVWIGQNYGNLPWKADPSYSYTDSEWQAELGRLNFYGGTGVTNPIRAGDLVEIRARGGLNYAGKMNVNEQHDNDPSLDFEIVRLHIGFGLPAPTPITLADLKNGANQFLFDATRQTGGEHYQATLVTLQNVWVTTQTFWTPNTDITVTDGTRTLQIHLGYNPSFDGSELFEVGQPFNVTGILDQKDSNNTGGYRVLAMNSSGFSPVPEPTGALLVVVGVLALGCVERGRARRMTGSGRCA